MMFRVLFYCFGALALTAFAFAQADVSFEYTDGRPLAYGGCWEGPEIPNGTSVYVKRAGSGEVLGTIQIDASCMDSVYNGGYICPWNATVLSESDTIYLEVSYSGVTYWTDEYTLVVGYNYFSLVEDSWTCEVEAAISPFYTSEPAASYALHQCYPNPFNAVTEISYDILNQGLVRLNIYDLLGRKVATLVNATQPAGHYIIPFDAASLATGIYIYRLQINNFVATKKMMFLK